MHDCLQGHVLSWIHRSAVALVSVLSAGFLNGSHPYFSTLLCKLFFLISTPRHPPVPNIAPELYRVGILLKIRAPSRGFPSIRCPGDTSSKICVSHMGLPLFMSTCYLQQSPVHGHPEHSSRRSNYRQSIFLTTFAGNPKICTNSPRRQLQCHIRYKCCPTENA